MTRTPLTPLHTPLCDLFAIDLPLLGLPLGDESGIPERVAAVSNAGALGIVDATGLPVNNLRSTLRAVRVATVRPFGVHLSLNSPAADALPDGRDLPAGGDALAGKVRIILDESVALLVVSGDPARVVELAHASAIKVGAVIASVAEARRAVALGVDLVIVRGVGAGDLGPLGQSAANGESPALGAFALAPAVADAVRAPIVVADAAMDGRGLVAALALGAAGVVLLPRPPEITAAAPVEAPPLGLAHPDAEVIITVIARAESTLDRLAGGRQLFATS